MVICIDGASHGNHGALLADMHRDRKRVFVDRLGWDIPHDGVEERDQFDTADARYLIVGDARGHLGSVRLLASEQAHLLDTLFPFLCGTAVPRGPEIMEISRLCFAPKCRGGDYTLVRNRLTTALVEYGLLTGVASYTLVANLSVYNGILAQGWRCRPLGFPAPYRGEHVAALLIHIDPDTIRLLRDAGTYVPGALTHGAARERVAA